MKEINSCEEYVIFELEKKREQVKRLTEACRNYIEVMDDVNRFLDIMKRRSYICRWISLEICKPGGEFSTGTGPAGRLVGPAGELGFTGKAVLDRVREALYNTLILTGKV